MKEKNILLKLFSSLNLLLIILSSQNTAYAAADIHFSKYRFVFDDNHRKDSLQLTNTGLDPARCKMSTINFIMNENGPYKLAVKLDKIQNSAIKILRYSPRQVTINAGNNQTVKIASRRKPNIKDNEYLSYLKIDCEELPNPNVKEEEKINIKPKFVYYVPLHVRVGKLTSSTSFENVTLKENNGLYTASFTQIRTGNRSIIGDVKIKEIKSGNILGVSNNTAIYVPFNKKEYSINLKRKPNGPVEIIYTEDVNLRGKLSLSAQIN